MNKFNNDVNSFYLHYVDTEKRQTVFGHSKDRLIDQKQDTFMFPDVISKEEAFTLISHLLNENKEDGRITYKSVIRTCQQLPGYGFLKLPYNGFPKPFDLYVTNDMDKVKNEPDFFEWFNDEYNQEEIDRIKDKLTHKYELTKRLVNRKEK